MTVIVDNTGFSVLHWSRFTQAEFIEQNIRQGVFSRYAEKDRRMLLTQTYQLIIDTTSTWTKT
jgi:hypothetical protein